MSYQDTFETTQTSTEVPASASPTTSPAHIIHRKPPANYSPIPFNSSQGSVHKTVKQFNNMRSTSIGGQVPTMSPAASLSKRSFSPINTATPSSTLKPSNNLPSRYNPPPAVTPVSASSSTPSPITNGVNDYPPPPPHAEWHGALKSCLALQNDAVTNHEKRPFAALLLGPDRTTTLLSHFSISHVRHAESELARLASLHYSIEYLKGCTLVSTWEPCAMCAGTIYWSGIGRVVYAASEAKLKELTGPGNNENMTMDLPCRTVFNAGQSKIDVVGPVPGWEEKVVEESKKWWRSHKIPTTNGVHVHAASTSGSVRSSSIRSYTVITNPPPAEGVTSRIGEDGEYKADLKVDWMN